MKNEILSEVSRRNLFLQPAAREYIESAGLDITLIRTLLNSLSNDKIFVTKQDVIDFLSNEKGIMTAEKVIPNKVAPKGEFAVVKGTDITGNSTCEATIEDFIKYFKSRYNILSEALMESHPEFKHAMYINKAKHLDRDVYLIGLVYEVSKTKNGHKIISLEDNSGSCSAFINRDSPLMSDPVITDELLGVRGKFSPSGLFIVDRIIRPGLPKNHTWTESDSKSSIAFISDVHVGSKEFIKSGWDNMITWMKHNAERQGINYLVLAGDVVDGIGAYPGQEEDLAELSIYKQYDCLAE